MNVFWDILQLVPKKYPAFLMFQIIASVSQDNELKLFASH